MLDDLGHRGGAAVLDGGWQAWLAAKWRGRSAHTVAGAAGQGPEPGMYEIDLTSPSRRPRYLGEARLARPGVSQLGSG
jgi:hypothetical protein